MAGNNRRQGMKLISMWITTYELEDIEKILSKPIKEECDLAQLGDILGSINARGDFNKR